MSAETPQEMLDRLSLIALGERECDLSENDMVALEWLLTTRAELLTACRNAVAEFEAVKEHQYKLLILGQTLESAAANWDEATLGKSVDYEPLMAAIAKAEGR